MLRNLFSRYILPTFMLWSFVAKTLFSFSEGLLPLPKYGEPSESSLLMTGGGEGMGFGGIDDPNFSPADAILALKNTAEGKAMLKEQLSAMLGDAEGVNVDDILAQLDEMEQNTPEGQKKRDEFNQIFAEVQKPFLDEKAQEEASQSAIEAQVNLEDEIAHSKKTTEKNLIPNPEPQETENEEDEIRAPEEINLNDWLEILENKKVPLSKQSKLIFRTGVFLFEKIVKSIRIPNNFLADNAFHLQLHGVLLSITLHEFRSSLQLRYLFADSPEAQKVRKDLVAAVKHFNKLAPKLSQPISFATPRQITSFLRNWEISAKNRGKKKSAQPTLSKQQAKEVKNIKNVAEEVTSCDEALHKILADPKLALEKANRRKLNALNPWLAKKYPAAYDRYQDRLNKSSLDNYYDPYYNKPLNYDYGNSNYQGGVGNQPPDNPSTSSTIANDSTSSNDSSDSPKYNVSVPEAATEELATLINSEIYKELLALDGKLTALSPESSRLLSENLLKLEFKDLPVKIKGVLKAEELKYTESLKQATSTTTTAGSIKHSKQQARIALGKIYRPIYYLRNNVKTLPVTSDQRSQDTNNQVFILPFRRQIDPSATSLQKSFEGFFKSPNLDSFNDLVSNAPQGVKELDDKVKSLDELLAIPELEPTKTVDEQVNNASNHKKTTLGLSTAKSTTNEISSEKIKKEWSNFAETTKVKYTQELSHLLQNLSASINSNSLNDDNFASLLSDFWAKLISALYDFPVGHEILSLAHSKSVSIKDQAGAFLQKFAEAYKSQMSQYLRINTEEEVVMLQVAPFLVYDLLGNFVDFKKALGYASSKVFKENNSINTTQKIMGEVVLLSSVFAEDKINKGANQKENLALRDGNGWESILQDFSLLLNFENENYQKLLTKDVREQLWQNTSLATRQVIPYPYQAWCKGSPELLNTQACKVYDGICKKAAIWEPQTSITTRGPDGSKEDNAIDSFTAITANLNGIFADLLAEEDAERIPSVTGKQYREELSKFILHALQKITAYNTGNSAEIWEPTSENIYQNLAKIARQLSLGIDIIFNYKAATHGENDPALNNKNYLVENILLINLPDITRTPSSEFSTQDLVKNVEATATTEKGPMRKQFEQSLDAIKKLFVWSLFEQDFTLKELAELAGIDNDAALINKEQDAGGETTSLALRKEVFTQAQLTQLPLLLAPFKPLYIERITVDSLQKICDFTFTLDDDLDVKILSKMENNFYQEYLSKAVTEAFDNLNLMPTQAKSVRTDVKTLSIIDYVVKYLSMACQKALAGEELSIRERSLLKELIRLAENIHMQAQQAFAPAPALAAPDIKKEEAVNQAAA